MTAVTLTIPGKPFGKKRARATAIRGHARMYNPAENISFERLVGTLANPHFPQPLNGAVKLTIYATFEVPQSWSKKKQEAALHRPHLGKPDLDNIFKAVKDGLNRIAWADDAQVACYGESRKVYGLTAQTVVIVEAMDNV